MRGVREAVMVMISGLGGGEEEKTREKRKRNGGVCASFLFPSLVVVHLLVFFSLFFLVLPVFPHFCFLLFVLSP